MHVQIVSYFATYSPNALVYNILGVNGVDNMFHPGQMINLKDNKICVVFGGPCFKILEYGIAGNVN